MKSLLYKQLNTLLLSSVHSVILLPKPYLFWDVQWHMVANVSKL